MESTSILKSSVQNASFSIIFQILSRCTTFLLNAFIIRHISHSVLGIMNVRLLLLESTILFLSREPILKACLTDTKSHNWAQVINQIWLTVPLSSFLGLALTYVWLNFLSRTEDIYWSQYTMACYAITLSCIIEQAAQSFFLVAQSFCFVKLKIIMDTIHLTVRTFVFVFLAINQPTQAITAFSLAQVLSIIVYSLGYFVFFWWYIKRMNEIRSKKKQDKTVVVSDLFLGMDNFKFTSVLDFFPGHIANKEGYLNHNLFVLTVSFAKQCVVKQVLTEGEKYVMTVSPVLTFSQQSVYDIVNNLGSLAARFIFRPVEESAYFYFTQMIKRDVAVVNQDQKSVAEAVAVLNHLLKIVTSIGLVVVVFGQSYSGLLLYLYGGPTLVDDTLPTFLLRSHCLAVLLLAINGVTECYVFATMNNTQLNKYNYLMVIFSIIFLIISYVLTSLIGPVGFIIANCVNMGARIAHSVIFISNKYKGTDYRPLHGVIPSLFFCIILTIGGTAMKLSEIYIYPKSAIFHLAVGIPCFLFTIIIWSYENKDLIRLGVNKYKRRASLKQD